MRNNRDEFKNSVKEELAKRVGYHCSNPYCRRQTIGPKVGKSGTISVGVASHISAAAKGGKRYNAKMTKEQRASIDNGIWMCQNCSKLIDSDEDFYSVGLLHKWKREAEEEQRKVIQQIYSMDNTQYHCNVELFNEIYDEVSNIEYRMKRINNDGGFAVGILMAPSPNFNEMDNAIKKIIEARGDLEEKVALKEREIPDDMQYFIKKLLCYLPAKNGLVNNYNINEFLENRIAIMGRLHINFEKIYELCGNLKLTCKRYE